MSKMMSILEKYKLVEKNESDSSSAESSVDENTPVTSTENITPFPGVNLEDPVTSSVESTTEEQIMPKHTQSETSNQTPKTTSPIEISQEVVEESTLYDRKISIEDVYSHYNLGEVAPTETVFLLENLINALPTELPEFVKKTTLDNIAKASAIDVEKLLSDGERRNSHLNHFINDFTTSNLSDIANLKQEIEKLSALMAEYHQQIKYKELLIQEETDLINSESNRINVILEFFKK